MLQKSVIYLDNKIDEEEIMFKELYEAFKKHFWEDCSISVKITIENQFK